ncbi:MAG: HsmA family protein [Spirochaetaceae bacterium]|nr:HsmA family protein [Spirochaetaceae bacterium]
MLIWAIIFITAALVFYTTGVWSEKKAGTLRPWHLILFWLGLVCDSTGTALMGRISDGSFTFNLHGITGALAILLMVFHAVWGTIVLVRKNPSALSNFHRLSVVVWGFWLIPYLIGLIVGMGGKA